MDITSVLSAIAGLGVLVRQVVEFIKSVVPYKKFPHLQDKIAWLQFAGKPMQWQQLVDVTLVVLLGWGAAVLTHIDLLAALNVTAPALLGEFVAGIAVALPSSLLNEVITGVEKYSKSNSVSPAPRKRAAAN